MSERPHGHGPTSAFWKVAGVLVGAQVATALLAVVLSGVFAQDRSAELLAGTLRLRLDAVAEEVEARAEIGPFGDVEIGDRLRADLGTRFPDPLALLDEAGAPVETFGDEPAPEVPPAALDALDAGRVAVDLDAPGGGWGLAPILAPDGLPAGALLVRPLRETVAEERSGTVRAFWRATAVTVAVAVALALLLGALFSARLLRPVREVTRRVERLGEGDYADRLPDAGPDELGRLARAVNEMAARVEASIQSLRDTDRLRRELVANVGHDLRTPLAALRVTLDEAERFASEGRTDDVEEAVAAARRQAEGAAALVADLFELSVLDRPDQSLRLEPVPLGELVADVGRQHARAFAADGVALDVDVPPGLPVVQADGARLARALANLLDNARRHTPAGGTVRLTASATGSEATLEVADTGEGMPPDVLAHVFERYYRGDGPRTRGAGTGLGLAIARAVAEAHGGALAAESAAGEGATFRLTLPTSGRNPEA
ncbi:ATP-binding protein [Rubrivirga sp.]|uniref:sensor histidine kinase n=1 Tax=Rubrivirga sp. TaxID=1885344 RepID=UPI003B525B6B